MTQSFFTRDENDSWVTNLTNISVINEVSLRGAERRSNLELIGDCFAEPVLNALRFFAALRMTESEGLAMTCNKTFCDRINMEAA